MVSTVRDHFDKFDSSIVISKNDFSDAKIKFEPDINGIDIKNEQQDTNLKSADFFDAKNFPKMTFVSNAVKKVSDYELDASDKLIL